MVEPKDGLYSAKAYWTIGTKESDETLSTEGSVIKVWSFGIISPVILRGKLLIQRLWQQGKDWDDEISEADALEWSIIKTDLDLLYQHKVHRCVTSECDQSVEFSLVCFCDASEKAYSAAI